MPEPLALLKTSVPHALRPLAVQASVENLDLVVGLHLEFGFDVVLTASSNPHRNPYVTLENASRAFYDRTGSYPQLDANRYAGPHRKIGATDLDIDWALKQVALGAPLIVTDAGYIHDDISQVRDAISKAVELQRILEKPVLATLAIAVPMLRNFRTELVDLVGASPIAIGLALGHAGDPLSSIQVVATLIELLALGKVHPRRIDLSGIGALAVLGSHVGDRRLIGGPPMAEWCRRVL